jgi:Ala-tRNA(Pro) deacylase
MKDLILKNNLFEMLSQKKINYKLTEHPAFYTVHDSEKYKIKIPGTHSKNLFLKNKKKHFFLFSCYEHQRVDLKKIGKSLNIGNISFANETLLYTMLGVKAGSVTPFGLLNDKEGLVKFFLDKKIFESDKINFHPLENTSTITLESDNFVKFLTELNIVINIFDFDNYLTIKQI